MLIELVLAITALNFLFSVWMLRLLTMELHKTVNQLDAMLATAIQGLIEKGMGEFEPVNPIQAAIAQILLLTSKSSVMLPVNFLEHNYHKGPIPPYCYG